MIENKQNIKSVIMYQDDKIFELEKQLHEGYVVNNNAKAGFLISLIAAIIGAIGIYGYVFVHTEPHFAFQNGEYFIPPKQFTLDVLVMAMLICQLVIVVLYHFSCMLGVSQRLEQFITFVIRCKAYETNPQEFRTIFPRKYCPFGKKGEEIVIGIFGEICKVLYIVFIIITLVTVFRVSFFYNTLNECCSRLWFAGGLCGTIFSLLLLHCIFKKYEHEYKKRQEEYCRKDFVCPYMNNVVSDRKYKLCVCKRIKVKQRMKNTTNK